MGLFHKVAVATLPLVPTPVMRAMAGRYIAGETLAEAITRLESLAARGFPGILDILGEDVSNTEEARKVAEDYVAAARELARRGLDTYVSIKPTHFGLRLDEALTLELYEYVARETAKLGLRVRVEMEDHSTTAATLRVFEALRTEHENVGIVLQSRLFRTLDDIDALAPGPLSVRMVKGIYLEPEELAHTEQEPIREAYVECCRRLFARGAYVSLATHDEVLADRVLALAHEMGLGRDDFEFQVLLGVCEPLWEQWQQSGAQVRIYVPFGPQWRPYSLRRLKKNPQIFRHIVRDILPW